MNNIADKAPTAFGEVGSLTQLHQHLWKECCVIKASRLVQSFIHPNRHGTISVQVKNSMWKIEETLCFHLKKQLGIITETRLSCYWFTSQMCVRTAKGCKISLHSEVRSALVPQGFLLFSKNTLNTETFEVPELDYFGLEFTHNCFALSEVDMLGMTRWPYGINCHCSFD